MAKRFSKGEGGTCSKNSFSITCFELLSGIRTTEHYESLRLRLRSFPDEPIDTSDHEEAAKASNQCRGKGIVVSIVDVLLCAMVMKREWAIFTTDPDFTNYAKVLSLTTHAPRK